MSPTGLEGLTESQVLAEALPHLVWFARSDGVVTYYNDRAALYAGLQAGSDGTYRWEPAVHPEDRARTEQAWADAVRRRELYECEHRVRMVDGTYRWHISRALLTSGGDETWIGTATDIHDLSEVEAALSESETRLRTLVDSIDQGYCLCEIVVDVSGEPVDYRFLETNALFEQATGLTDAAGHTALELVPDLEPVWLQTYAGVAMGDSAVRFQQDSAALGRRFDVFAMPVAPRGRFVLVFADITEQHAALTALQESEQRFRNVADHAPVMVWMTDAEGACTFLNRRWCDFTGQVEAEALGVGWLEATHPDDRRRAQRTFLDATRRREAFSLDYRLRRHDGEYRWAIDAAAPRMGDDGQFLGYVGSVMDITDRKRLEVALADSEQRFRSLADNLPLLVWIHDANGAQTFVNTTFCDYFGVTVDDMKGGRWQLLTHPDDGDQYAQNFRQSVEARTAFHGEVRVQRSDGEWRWLESWAEPQFDAAGRFIGHLGTSADITDRKSAEQRLQEQRDEEHRISLQLQKAMLPSSTLVDPRVDIATAYEASTDQLQVGGDWFETFRTADGRVAVLVGDVVGHSVEAAAAMGQMRAGLLALTRHVHSPHELLDELDRFASDNAITDFATVVCLFVDPDDGSIQYASAGHPPPIICNSAGETTWLDGGRSLPIGVGQPTPRISATAFVGPASAVLVYSDGLIERRKDSLGEGFHRLASAVCSGVGLPLDALLAGVLRELRAWLPFEDDTAVVALRFREVGA